MELKLTLQPDAQVAVNCNGQLSHHFDLRQLIPDDDRENGLPQPLADPVAYGQALYQALFPPDQLSGQLLGNEPDRILLVTGDDLL